MRPLSDTITRLARLRAAGGRPENGDGPDRLADLGSFGPDPGRVRARVYFPETLREGAPLVLVLHGCMQTAAGYDRGSGWSRLADEAGFALLFAEQQRANNANVCFNWFAPEHVARGSGEALSIRSMVEAVVATRRLDRNRVFVTGLSAGGAMTAAMLASYPEVFTGGAIIAGLPFGVARSVPEAFDRMRGHGLPPAAELAARVRGASGQSGSWPTLSVWHGTADQTVSPANAEAVLAQWRGLRGLPEAPDGFDTLEGGHGRRVWRDRNGREVLESVTVAGLGHGTPLGDDGLGEAGPFMLPAGISSTRHIAGFWGLVPRPRSAARGETDTPRRAAPPAGGRTGAGVGQTITEALRAAGLVP